MQRSKSAPQPLPTLLPSSSKPTLVRSSSQNQLGAEKAPKSGYGFPESRYIPVTSPNSFSRAQRDPFNMRGFFPSVNTENEEWAWLKEEDTEDQVPASGLPSGPELNLKSEQQGLFGTDEELLSLYSEISTGQSKFLTILVSGMF
ncbi:hypothetical protein C8J56DRAFT_918606 [Mycena floridula]|nr:hypothetical protein C8J56DRAFT_918606 [Mycena floridula]